MKTHPIIRFLLCLTVLAAASGVSAQHMPERSLVRKGNRQYDKGNYEQSIERYTRALEAAPQNFEAAYDLGNALYKAERFDKAEQTMRAAAADTLRTDDERAEAFYNLGNAQFKQEKYREALESYKQSLRLNPADEEAKYNYAYTKRLLEENEQQQDQQQDKNKDQDQQQDKDQQQGGQDQKQDQQDNPQQDQQQDQQDQQQENPAEPEDGQGDGQAADAQAAPEGISPEEQERMLDAIQAQEDKTQEKLKEKQGVVVRGKKNW